MNRQTTRQSILIVDDELLFAKAVGKKLGRGGFDCAFATTLGEAEQALAQSLPDLLLLDMRLPDGSGLDFLRRHGGEHPGLATVVVTAYGELEDAVSAMKYGALDYLTKPVDLERLQTVLDSALDRAARNRMAASPIGAAGPTRRNADESSNLLGESPVMHELHTRLERIAALAGRVDEQPPTVLLSGETGTGKDRVARWLHAYSPRRARPFVQVDCAALPRELIESELFGHERGAFTGAQGERVGLIESAGDGTVLLDEIGELPLELQAKLLAVLERRVLRRIGSSRERPVAAWFIAASNRDLADMAARGEFRSDLYYRLRVLELALPPLRQREADIELLARHFAVRAAEHYDLPVPEFTAEALAVLHRHRWPGNVRELKNVIERAVLLGGEGRLEAADLLLDERPLTANGSSHEPEEADLDLEQTEIELIRRALEATDGNISAAARRLGITRMTLRYRMQKYGIMAAH